MPKDNDKFIEVKETKVEVPFEPGAVAYNAYCSTRNWKSVRGEPLPSFNEQSEELKQAWINAAHAVIDYYNITKKNLKTLPLGRPKPTGSEE